MAYGEYGLGADLPEGESLLKAPRAMTVEQLNTFIGNYLAGSPLLSCVTVKGEVSNLRAYGPSGHLYFTLKDEKSTIPATMFGGLKKLKFDLKDNMKVICTGKVAVFVRDGQYRIYADDIQPDGVGALAAAFEELKRKLNAEGLFDPAHKKKLPKYPFRVGLITAANGAAVRDMINVTRRRFPAAKILLAPATVQGPSAPGELIAALKLLDENKLCDVIIIGRGGGSTEDLWCFNDEALARAVYACETPIISAVGHEIDFTICDFVADQRAPTPSAAAELAVPDLTEELRKFGNVQKILVRDLENRTASLKQRLLLLASRPVLVGPRVYFDERKMQIGHLEERMQTLIEMRLERQKQGLKLQGEKLCSLNPLAVLERGYSVALGEDGTVLKTVSQFEKGKTFTLRVSDGTVKASAE